MNVIWASANRNLLLGVLHVVVSLIVFSVIVFYGYLVSIASTQNKVPRHKTCPQFVVAVIFSQGAWLVWRTCPQFVVGVIHNDLHNNIRQSNDWQLGELVPNL